MLPRSQAACSCLTVLAMLCLSGLASAQSSLPVEVIRLDDKTFEHQTQAATGQTTGRWLVLFTGKCERCQVAESAWQVLAEVDEKEVLVAQVDVDSSPKTAARFDVRAPTALLFRDRKMYRYRGAWSNTLSVVEDVTEFLAEGFESQEGKEVPAAPVHVEVASDNQTVIIMTAVAVVLMIGIMVASKGSKKPADVAASTEVKKPEPAAAPKKGKEEDEEDEKQKGKQKGKQQKQEIKEEPAGQQDESDDDGKAAEARRRSRTRRA